MTLFQRAGKAAGTAMKTLGATLASMGIAWLAGKAISLAITGLDHLANATKYEKQALEDATETAKKYADQIKTTKEENEKNAKSANDIAEKYAKLAQGVDVNTNKNKLLSNDDYKEFLNLNKQLADLFPTLTKGHDENGNAILGLSGDVDTVTESIRKLVEQQERLAKQDLKDSLEKYVNGDDDSKGQLKVIEGQKKKVDDLKKNLSDLNKYYNAIINGETLKEKGSSLINLYFLKLADAAKDTKNYEFLTSTEKYSTEQQFFRDLFSLGRANNEYDFSKLKLTKDDIDSISATYQNLYSDLQSQLDTANSELANKNKELSQQMMIWVEDLDIYKDNESLQTPLTDLISNIDWDSLGITDFEEVKDYIQKNILTPLQTVCKDPEAKAKIMSSYASLFSIDFSKMSFKDANKKIQELFKNIILAMNPDATKEEIQKKMLDMYQSFGFGDYDKSTVNMKNSLESITKGNADDFEKLTNYTKSFNQEQVQAWLSSTNGAKSADEAIKKYETSLEKSQKSSFKSFKEAWADLDKVSDDSDMKDTKKELLELAEAGKLTEKTFKEVSGSDTFLSEIGISSKEAVDNINHLVESTKQLSSMKTGISSIREAYSTRKDNKNKLGADTLSSMYDTLGINDWSDKDKKVWTEYKNAAEDTSVSMDEFKKKQDALATSFVNTGNYLGGITKQSKERYVAMLKEMGVINAEEVATKALETKAKTLKETKDKLGISSKELKSINLEEADALDDLDLSADGAKKALYDYMIQKIQCGNIKLDTATECTNLYNLALKAGIAANKLRELLNAQIQYNTYERVSSNVKGLQDVINSSDDENKEITFTTADGDVKKFKNKKSATNQLKGWGTVAKNAKSRAEKNVEKFNKKNKVNLGVDVQTQKGSGKDKKDKNSSSKDKSKSTQVIDWIERRLNRLNSTIDYTTSKLQNMFTIKQKSNEIDKQIKTSTKLINAYGIAADKYKKKANQVAKSSTKTVTNSKGKKKKKKVSSLSNGLIKNIQNGRLKGKKLSDLIATYGEDTAEKIQSYQDYWDKYQDARKNKQDEIAKRRQYKIDKEQNYVDKADEKYNKNEALKENAKSASEKNIILKDERENLKDSYKHQIEIAKINKDKVEQARLNAELQKKLNDIAIEQHQNIVDELDRNNESLEAQKQNLKTASEKNSIVEQQKVIAQQTYAEQIEIAKLQYGVGSDEVKKLQEEQKSKLADFENEKFENIQTEYSNWLDMIQSRIDGLDGSISIVEAKGITATQGLYQGKVAVEKENLSTLQAEKVALEEQHKSTEVGTALWYSQEKSLNDVSTAIINAQKNMIEYRNSIREANDKVLELKKSFIDLGNIYLD